MLNSVSSKMQFFLFQTVSSKLLNFNCRVLVAKSTDTNLAKNWMILKYYQDAHTSLTRVPRPCGTDIHVVQTHFMHSFQSSFDFHIFFLVGPNNSHWKAPRNQSIATFNEQVLVGVLSPMRNLWARHLAREAWASPQNMKRQGARVVFLLAQDR